MTQEAKTERRRLVARRVFEALCAQYPEKHRACATKRRDIRRKAAERGPIA
jgi:hypothetical protein